MKFSTLCLRMFSLFLVLLSGITEASAAPMTFTFSGTATEARSKPAGGDYRPGIGGGGVGTQFQGGFTLSDQELTDTVPGGSTDSFQLNDRRPLNADVPARDLRLRWNFAGISRDTGDLSDLPPNYPFLPGGGLELVDSAEGDFIRLSIRSNTNANHSTNHLLVLELTDPTGTAFDGVDGLTGSYADALITLGTVDLSLFTQARGTLDYDVGGHSIYRENIVFDLTALSADVAEPVPDFSLISRRFDTSSGADGTSWDPSISGDGNLIAFSSDATNLVSSDSNGSVRDIYLYNRSSGEMRNLTGGGNGASDDPVLSKDGRWLAFRTQATNLPTDMPDTNGPLSDIVIASVATGELTLVTQGANGASSAPSISGDGRRLVYETLASNLTNVSNHHPIGCNPASPNDAERCVSSVVLYDRVSRFALELTQGGTTPSRAPTISETGTHVVFESRAFSTLTGRSSMIVMNLETGTRTAIGFDEHILENSRPLVSPDGRYVAAMHVPVSTRSYVPNSVYVFDTLDNSRRWLGPHSALPGGFTSDNRWLVFTEALVGRFASSTIDYQPAVYRVDVSVSGELVPERLTPIDRVGGPSVSADGSVVAFDSVATIFADDNNGDLFDVFVLDTNTNTTNQAPVAQPQTLNTTADNSLQITLGGFDADGDALQFIIRDEPANGNLDGVPPELTYTADAGYSGSDQFTFVVQDDQSTSEPAVVQISIEGVANSEHSITAVQRADSRIIDLQVSWPFEAVWTQVREYDGSTGILWDGPLTQWSGSYEPAAGVESVTFNSRYWLPGITAAWDSIDVTVELTGPPSSGGLAVDGFAWLDADGDSVRDENESPDIGRDVALYRCEAPWGIAGTATTAGALGAFEFTNLTAGKYQIGTASEGVEFSPLGFDNAIFNNGFSDCFDVSEGRAQVQTGIGVLVSGSNDFALNGFAWIDSNNDGVRDSAEDADVGRTVTAYRCSAPWGVAGTATTDADGVFAIQDVVAGMYQFGIAAEGLTISPKANDNELYENGFSDCLDFNTGNPQVGMGIVNLSGSEL